MIAYNIALIVGIKVYYMWRNASREKKWNAMSERERVGYLATTSDKGNKRYVLVSLMFHGGLGWCLRRIGWISGLHTRAGEVAGGKEAWSPLRTDCLSVYS